MCCFLPQSLGVQIGSPGLIGFCCFVVSYLVFRMDWIGFDWSEQAGLCAMSVLPLVRTTDLNENRGTGGETIASAGQHRPAG